METVITAYLAVSVFCNLALAVGVWVIAVQLAKRGRCRGQ